MNETITRRRSQIEDELRATVPSWVFESSALAEDGSAVDDGTFGPRTRAQVFYAVSDALSKIPFEPSRFVPVAVALELAHVHLEVHQRAAVQLSASVDEYDPTMDILRGDVLLSRAFEQFGSVDLPADRTKACLSELSRACRRAQEAYAMVAADDLVDSVDGSTDFGVVSGKLESRLGALVGCAGAVGGLVAGVDLDEIVPLREHSTRLGSHLRFARLLDLDGSRLVPVSAFGTPKSIDRCVEGVVECFPPERRETGRAALAAIVDASLAPTEHHES
ncbi:hypothetical protein [Halovivax gelatinilyticus]|uniref:hypothetical protein n=1 Tax=Halovivax gelatinilyticus TaxID=2961597 RepID=UPI0020CA70BE|nr:hypothetical protein [Halovivax gelatinilyticus]